VRHGILSTDSLLTVTIIRIIEKLFTIKTAKYEFVLTTYSSNAADELYLLWCVEEIIQETKKKMSNTKIIMTFAP